MLDAQEQGKQKMDESTKKELKSSVPGTGSDGRQATAEAAEFTAVPPPYTTTASSSTASGSIRFSNENRQHQHQHRQQQKLLLSPFQFWNPGFTLFSSRAAAAGVAAAAALSVCRYRADALRSEHAQRPTPGPRRPHTAPLLLMLL